MDHQKIDRLFREKLNSFEATPSAKAWADVEKQIGSKKSAPKFYLVAAAVSLIILTWVAWPQNDVTNLRPITSEVNHPMLEDAPDWSIPALAKANEEERQTEVIKPKLVKRQVAPLVAKEVQKELIDETLLDQAPSVELSETAVAEISEEFPVMENPDITEEVIKETTYDKPIKVDFSQVKITYIASNSVEKKQADDSVKGVKRLFAIAGKISPGEVLADIKTAKDDFINSGFKSKNKDRSSL